MLKGAIVNEDGRCHGRSCHLIKDPCSLDMQDYSISQRPMHLYENVSLPDDNAKVQR